MLASMDLLFRPLLLFPSNSYPETLNGNVVYGAGAMKRDVMGE